MGQTYSERRPVPALARYVSCVWLQRVGPDAPPYAHRTIPNAGVEISCRLGALPQVIGPQSGPSEEVLSPGTTVVGVRFRPGAAPAALRVPASELVDVSLGADELWNRWAVALGERVADAASPAQAAATLERELLARMRDCEEPDALVAEGVRRLMPGRAREVTSLTSSLFISESQLRRRFRTATGFAPKAVHRILRFQGFLALAGESERPSEEIALLAAAAGYVDQSHLARECLRLAGKTPRALLRESEQQCHGVHDHAASYAPLLRSRVTGSY